MAILSLDFVLSLASFSKILSSLMLMGEVMLETFIRFNTREVFRGVLLIFLADGTFLVELAPKACFG